MCLPPPPSSLLRDGFSHSLKVAWPWIPLPNRKSYWLWVPTHLQRTGPALLCASSTMSHYMPGEVMWGLGLLNHSVAAASSHSQTAEKSSQLSKELGSCTELQGECQPQYTVSGGLSPCDPLPPISPTETYTANLWLLWPQDEEATRLSLELCLLFKFLGTQRSRMEGWAGNLVKKSAQVQTWALLDTVCHGARHLTTLKISSDLLQLRQRIKQAGTPVSTCNVPGATTHSFISMVGLIHPTVLGETEAESYV